MPKMPIVGPYQKRIWITGASSGLGAALAYEYAAAGEQVYLSARSPEQLENVNSTLPLAGKVYPCDVTNDTELSATIESISVHAGALDIAILNAGTYKASPLNSFDISTARSLFEVNFFSIVRTIEILTNPNAASAVKHIVVVSSVAGDIGLPYAGFYSASKAALNRLCESLQPELAMRGIRISVVNPGFIRTPLTDKNDFPMPFLIDASRAARTIKKGIENEKYEIRFPLVMGMLMRGLSFLPRSVLLLLTKRMLKK